MWQRKARMAWETDTPLATEKEKGKKERRHCQWHAHPSLQHERGGKGGAFDTSDEQCGTQEVDRPLGLAKDSTGMVFGDAQHKQASILA